MVGSEEYGIASGLRRHCRDIVKISMFGYKRSMNLHHALAIVAHAVTGEWKGERRVRAG